MKKKFTRRVRGRNTDDARGTVRVVVSLASKNSLHTKGNITRSMSFTDATVTEVATVIADILTTKRKEAV